MDYPRPVDDHNLQILWTGHGQQYMIVQEYGTEQLLMSTFSGYLSPRLYGRNLDYSVPCSAPAPLNYLLGH